MEHRQDVTILSLNGKTPRIHPSAFLAPGCCVIGDVEIGQHASIWYRCVVRADFNYIRIGDRTNVQDGSVIHCDNFADGKDGFPTIIGNDVLIGHMSMLHGCTLRDGAFVGMRSIVMDGCTIESEGMLAAGAMLTPGKAIAHRELWSGAPAKYMRQLDDGDVAGLHQGVRYYVANARRHKDAGRA